MSPQTARSAVEAPRGAEAPGSLDRGLLQELDSVAAHTGVPEDIRPAVIPPELSDEIAQWLKWQCQMISGVQRGAVFLRSRSRKETLDIAGSWPKQSQPSNALRMAAERAIADQRSVVKKAIDEGTGASEVADFVGQPLLQDGTPIGAVALALDVRAETQRRAVMQLLGWATGWLEVRLRHAGDGANIGASLANESIEKLTQDFPLPIVGHELCNLLAERLQCSQVVLGLADGMQVRVLAMSHQLGFDRRVNRVTGVEAAMEECVDQSSAINLPTPDDADRRVSQAHEKLLREQRSFAVCSVPLVSNDEPLAVLTLTRDDSQHFDATTMESLTHLVTRLAPVLDLKRREARSGVSKTLKGLSDSLLKLIGAGHVRAKLLIAFLLAMIAGLLFIQIDTRVTARSTLEGRIQQVVSAPFAGYIREAGVRAGERVVEGQVLAELDDRDLLLEQEKLISERDKQRREYQEALARRERAKVSVIQAQIDQTEARLRLVEDKLERTAMKAPFSGTVVSGDLSRSLGAPVERGQPLFELVPDEGYRVSMQVNEFDIALLEPGQLGSLRLAGLPDRPVEVEVSRIVPIADAFDGGNSFRVEGEILAPSDDLRPGMQGVAKVVVGQGSLLRSWTRDLVQRLRLWAWSVGF